MKKTPLLLSILAFVAVDAVNAAQARKPDLLDLPIEQLGQIEVTSVSRRPQPLIGAPASIYVITADDIRRSGATTLPEALRLAPNLQIARTSAATYAISSRGFAADSVIGNKLLVLIDGRTVYSPLFSGVFWDMQDVMLEDVERIEVISGPGATLYGANAVNGVINVTTRKARDTQGPLIALGAGNTARTASVRYGGTFGNGGHYRLYGSNWNLDNTERANGTPISDGWEKGQVGFRADWGGVGRTFTVQGEAYKGAADDRVIGGAVRVHGANILARWNERLGNGSDFRLQAYYDTSEREDMIGFQGNVDIFDLEFQHGFALDKQRIVWGGGYRTAGIDVPDTIAFPLIIRFIPEKRRLDWENVYVQDEIRLTGTLKFTPGIKFERNDYTGWETLPSVRLAWQPVPDRVVWGSISRAVRAPSRLDRDFFLIFPPNFGIINGGPNFQSEVADVFELGYRAQPTQAFWYSITGFHHIYDRLRSGQLPPAVIENRIEGVINGIEGWASYQVTPGWRLSGGFTTLHEHLGIEPGSLDPTGPSALGNDPDHQWSLRSSHDLPNNQELDIMLRRVASLPQPAVPAYTALDVRWGWKVNRGTEVSLTLRNLLDPQHPEFNAFPDRSEFERSVFLKVVLTR